MGRHPKEKSKLSRRAFLGGMRWAPLAFLPAPFHTRNSLETAGLAPRMEFPFADYRLTPHYPRKSPLEDVLRYVAPGTDQYITEKYAMEISQLLTEWAMELRREPSGLTTLASALDPSMRGASLSPSAEKKLRAEYGVEVLKRNFPAEMVLSREQFLEAMRKYLAEFKTIETAEFQITRIREVRSAPLTVEIEIRYDLVGTRGETEREERIGHWKTEWARPAAGA